MLAGLIYLPLISPSVAEAAFNPAINYQGKLTDASDVTVADGDYNMQFRLYTAATGGEPIWQETLCFSPDSGDTCDGTGTDSRISLTSGLFSVLLGSVSSTSLRAVNFNQDLYLGVNIGGTGSTPSYDGEMTPRKQLGAVPAAFQALQLDGLATTSLLRSDASDQFTSGTLTFNSGTTLDVFGTFNTSFFSATSSTATSSIAGILSVGSTTPASRALFSIGTSTQNLLVDKFSGFTGLSTSTPGSILSIGGVANFTSSTSTFYGTGINLASGCFAVNGTCLPTTDTGATTYLALTDTPSGFTANTIPYTDSGASALLHNTSLTFDGTTLTIPALAATSTLSVTGLSTLTAGFVSQASSTVVGDFTVTGTPTFDTALSVTSGGTGAATLGSDELLLGAGTGVITSTTSLSVYRGGTGSTTLTGILKGNGTGQVQSAVAGTDYVADATGDWTGTLDGIEGANFLRSDEADTAAGLITFSNGLLSQASSTIASTLTISDILTVSATGTSSIAGIFSVGSTTPASRSLFSIGTSTQNLLVDKFSGFTGLSTSTPGSILSIGGVANFTSATSTFYGNGINLSAGCFAINGTCVGGGGGTINSGTAGQIPYYASAGTTLSGTSTLFVASNERVGIGTTTPQGLLSVATSTNNPFLTVNPLSGFVGLGTSTPQAMLHVTGSARFDSTVQFGQPIFAEDSGLVVWTDLPVSTSAATGTLQGYIAQVDGNDVLTVIGRANGQGGVNRLGVAIGTTTPNQLFTIATTTGDAAIEFSGGASSVNQWTLGFDSSDGYKFKIASSSTLGTNDRFIIDSSGQVGIGTSTPSGTFAVAGTSFLGGNVTATGTLSVTNTATSSFAGILSVGSTTPASRSLFSIGTSTQNLLVDKFSGFTGLSTSTPGSILSIGGVANFTSATSTFYGNGINLSAGCFAINGTCVGGGGGATTYLGLTDTPSGFTANTIPYTDSGASALLHNTSLTFDGTTLTFPQLVSTSTASSTFAGPVTSNSGDFIVASGDQNNVLLNPYGGNVGVGTSTPYAKLGIWGDGSGTAVALEVTDNASTTRFAVRDNGLVILGNTAAFSTSELHITDVGATGSAGTPSTLAQLTVEHSDNMAIQLLSRSTNRDQYILFGDSGDNNIGHVRYDHASDYMSFQTNNAEQLWITSAGRVGVATSAPSVLLAVGSSTPGTVSGYRDAFFAGDVEIDGQLFIESTATSSFAGILSVGSTTPASRSLFSIGTSTQNLLVDKFSGFTGLSTSTPGSILSIGGVANFTSATSTFYGNGINLSAGCFAINGTCVGGGGGGSGTVNSGTAGHVAYYNTTGTAVSGTSTLFLASNERVGIGSSTPLGKLSLAMDTVNPSFIIANTASATPALWVGGVNQNGYIGIGTSTPSSTSTSTPFSKLTLESGSFLQVPGSATSTIILSQTTGMNYGIGLDVAGRYAYTIHGGDADDSRLRIVDVSNPKSPTIVSALFTSTGLQDVKVVGKYAYIVDSTNDELTIVDISNPTTPVEVGSIPLGGDASTLDVVGRYAYIVETVDDTLTIVDVSRPTNPSVVGTLAITSLAGPATISVQEMFAYIIDDGTDKLHVVDISNPASPILVSATSMGTNPEAMFMSGRYVYTFTSGDGVFKVFDVKNPASPSQVGSITMTSGDDTMAMYGAGRYIYLTSNNRDVLDIIDVSSPTAPFLANRFSITGLNVQPRSMVASGRYLYAYNYGTNALFVIDTTGIDVVSGRVGSLQAGNLDVRERASFTGGVSIGTGLTVGPAGILSQGPLSVSVASTTVTNPIAASFLGRTSVGTTTPYANLSVWGGSSGNILEIVTSASTTALSVSATGFGTTTLTGLNITGSATSTSDVGINITTGCFAISGTCVGGGGGGSGTVNSGTAGHVAYYNTTGTAVSGTSTLFLASNERVGIGTTTPQALLSVATSTNNPFLAVSGISGFVGIGTSTPQAMLHVTGSTRFDSSVQFGQFQFASSSGKVAWVDMEVTGSAADDVEQSYTARIDGKDILTVFARSDGAGSVDNLGVSIGTTTPAGLFTIATTSVNVLNVTQNGGIVVGAPTGGDKGLGTINAQAVYDDNTLLTDYVFDFYFDGKVTEEDEKLHGGFRLMTIDEMRDFVSKERHLPSITGREEWKEKKGISLGQLVSQIWEATEISAIYLSELDSRLDALDGGLGGSLLQGSFDGEDQLPSKPLTVKALEVSGDLTVKGRLYLSSDSVGQAKVIKGQTLVRVDFSSPYLTPPIVTVTPSGALGDFHYAVLNADPHGFEIGINKPFDGDIVFNWHAFASSFGPKVTNTTAIPTSSSGSNSANQGGGSSTSNSSSPTGGQSSGNATNTASTTVTSSNSSTTTPKTNSGTGTSTSTSTSTTTSATTNSTNSSNSTATSTATTSTGNSTSSTLPVTSAPVQTSTSTATTSNNSATTTSATNFTISTPVSTSTASTTSPN
jgi:hypothetical protein